MQLLSEINDASKACVLFNQYLVEIASNVDPRDAEKIITQSFKDNVVSDLLAANVKTGDTITGEEAIENVRKQFPQLKNVVLKVNPSADRIRIYFGKSGEGEHIDVPDVLKKGLGEVLILHEIAHMLYTKDLLSKEIVGHKYGAQAFTILRVLEDIAIEQALEEDHPAAVEVFKTRAQHIIPIYKKHVPSDFSKKIDEIFLHLRGYKKDFGGDPEALRLANVYLRGKEINTKINAVINLTNLLMRTKK